MFCPTRTPTSSEIDNSSRLCLNKPSEYDHLLFMFQLLTVIYIFCFRLISHSFNPSNLYVGVCGIVGLVFFFTILLARLTALTKVFGLPPFPIGIGSCSLRLGVEGSNALRE
jgi:hypothetical protein